MNRCLQHRAIAFAAFTLLATNALPTSAHEGAAVNLDTLPTLDAVAADAIQISPQVPNMGEHWARAADLPVGPIYCVIDGRVTCVEYMFQMMDLKAGTDWLKLAPGMETPPISHIDIEFKPDGVGPNPEPLYQVHIYFATPELLARH